MCDSRVWISFNAGCRKWNIQAVRKPIITIGCVEAGMVVEYGVAVSFDDGNPAHPTALIAKVIKLG